MKTILCSSLLLLFIVMLSVLVVSIVVPVEAYSQAPQAFNYQAIVRNTSGAVIQNQNVSLRISLLQDSVTGIPVFVEEHAATTNTFGLVNLKIGNGAVVSGIFAAINWSAGSYFIKIELDATGGSAFTEMGVSQLLSVPYALYAASGNQGPQGLQGLPGVNGQNGISVLWLGTFTSHPVNPIVNNAYYNSSDKKSYVYDGIGWQIIAQDGMQGLQGIQGEQGPQGPAGTYIAGTGINISNDTIYSVNASYYAGTGLNLAGTTFNAIFGSTAGTISEGNHAHTSYTVGGANGNLQFNNGGVFGGNNVLFWDNNNLRLGIGTSSPTSTLHINGTLRITDDTEGAGKILTSDALGYASWQMPASGGSITGTQNHIAKFTSPNSIGNSLLYENGNYIGLGTTAPLGRFVVQGDSLSADSVPLFEVKDKTGQSVFVIWPNGAQFYLTADTTGSKAAQNKGSFAISGRTTSKDVVKDYLSVNADSIKASKSLYIPRMTTTERDNLGFTPSDALIIFNTTDECMEIYKNGVWSNIWCFNCAPAFMTQPVDHTICSGNNTNFFVSLTGTNLVYQWQQSANGGATWTDIVNGGTNPAYSGATSLSLSLTNVPVSFNTYKYRCNVSAACPPGVTSAVVTLNVISTPPLITSNPTNQNLSTSCTATFSISSPGFGLTYQWQQSPDGNTWSDISNGGSSPSYSGATTASLSLSNVPLAYNNYQYRCIAGNICGTDATSNPATLTVTPITISAQPADLQLPDNYTATFTVTVSGPALLYQWQQSEDGGVVWSDITNGGTSPAYSGATNFTISLTDVPPAFNTYEFRCIISHFCRPAVTSNAATLTISVPTLTTTAASNVSSVATSGGNVTGNGGAAVTARGVCWGTGSNPVVTGSHTTDGTGTGAFISNITGLATTSTTYYVRAYATNGIGTAYGNEITFTSLANCGAVADVDGNTYNTITIGTQCWMHENLKTAKYRDGTAIPNVIDNATWAALTTGARSYYNNDSTTNTPVYGVLYNWYAATDVHNLCPTSWHVPTHDEWTTLERAICTSGTCVTDFPYDITTAGYRGTDEGGKMKETGTIHWTSPNTGATNSSGFGALPGGSRYFNGTYDNVGSNGYWWSATAYDAVSAWLRILGYNYSQVYRYNSSKTYGFSVRCVRD